MLESEVFLVVALASEQDVDALLALCRATRELESTVLLLPGASAALVERLRASDVAPRVAEAEPGRVVEAGRVYVGGAETGFEVDGRSVAFVDLADPARATDAPRAFVTSAVDAFEDRIALVRLEHASVDATLAAIDAYARELGALVIDESGAAHAGAKPARRREPSGNVLATRPGTGGRRIEQIVRMATLPTTADERAALDELLVRAHEATGIDFAQFKRPTILRRLARLMALTECGTIAEYLAHLGRAESDFQEVASAFLINVTGFFRDADVFDHLAKAILPELIAQARARGGELRLWSSGTSTGEEAYSLAMLCVEALQDGRGPAVPVRIFATDIDRRAVAFARRGLYGPERVGGVSEERLRRFFTRSEQGWRVGEAIRSITIFGEHDLAQRAPFPHIDLCLCRNVLIYFTKPLQKRALQTFAYALRDGGYLIVGKAETTSALPEFFQQTRMQERAYRRQGGQPVIPLSRAKDPILSPRARYGIERRPGGGAPHPPQDAGAEARLAAYDPFLENGPIGIVTVRKRYAVARINQAAREMLDIRGIGVGDDLVHLLRNVDSESLRETIDAAFRGEPLPARVMRLSDPSDEQDRWIELSCMLPSDRDDDELRTVALVCVDVTGFIGERERVRADLEREAEARAALAVRVRQLVERQRVLFKENAELVGANDELRQANDQLMLAAEEAASAHEEIETLNEEMQSTNEELETLNEELQATIEELNTTNDELESRSKDLEFLARAQEIDLHGALQEIEYYKALLDQSGPPIVVIRRSGDVLYASASLGPTRATALPPNWWSRDRVAIDATTYAIERIVGTSLEIVGFRLTPT